MKNLLLLFLCLFISECFSQNLEQIKKADTVYIYFENDKNLQGHKVYTIKDTKTEYYHFVFTKTPIFNWMQFLHGLWRTDVKVEKKSFLKKNKDLIITYDFLTQFVLSEATELLEDKQVYLIDKKDFRWGQIKLKEVDIIGFPRLGTE